MKISRKTFCDISIKRKLIAINMLAASLALLPVCAAFTVYEVVTLRSTMVRELSTIAQMVSESNSAALAFNDPKAASETLSILKAEPRIVAACIYRRTGSVFAKYVRAGEAPDLPIQLPPEGAHFAAGHLVLAQEMILDHDNVGTVYLRSDLREMYSRLKRYASIAIFVLWASALVALLVSSTVQAVISRPVLHLAETASRASAEQNYSLRARKPGNDEIGTLVDRFNEMMSQLQARDAALQEAHEELELRVADRTKKLQSQIAERERVQQNLLAAKQAAEESDEAKSAFLANMSHELRTPLNAIIGYSELLEEQAADEGNLESVADLRRIHSAGRHLLALINDVLDLSKVEAGRMEVHIEPLQIGAVIDEVSDTVEPLVMRNRNVFTVRNGAGDGVIYTDRTKFRQRLLNLLSNACKFTERGSVTLRVERRHADGREWLDWDVVDTGIGIRPEHMAKLFKSFSQVDSSATRKYGGTGLGLAISQRLCQMMGGRITAQSEPGKGSTFRIRIPADPVSTVSGEPAEKPGRTGVGESEACPKSS